MGTMLHGQFKLMEELKMATTQPIRSKRQIRRLTAHYLKLGQLRNQLLIVITLHTALRISDVLRLKWDDVYDFEEEEAVESISIKEKKTGKLTTIALHKSIITALTLYAPTAARKGGFLFLNAKTKNAIGRVQAYRIIRSAAEAVGIKGRDSCHSLRKTFGYHAWKDGVSPAILVEIYNHNSLAVTRRYLGVTQDDKDSVYLGIVLSA